MNREVLESLLMDRTLNSLPSETEQLLAAYLSEHPEYQDLADSIQQTAALGRQALLAELPELPPFPQDRILHRHQSAGWKSAGRWMSMAACILIGIGIGISSIHWQAWGQQKLTADMSGGYVKTRPQSGGLDIARAFWSTETYINRYEQIQRTEQNKARENPELQKQIEEYRKRGIL